MSKYKHTVTSEEYGQTINQILRANYKFSARFKTKMKYQSLVDLNGTPTKGYIKPEVGDIIGVRLPEESNDFPAEDIPLDVIYEDDDLLIINKQPGIIVHPTKGHPEHTIANGLMKYMADTKQNFKIRFANRIDMDTSGIIVVAKNANAQNELSSQMRRGTVKKKYIALVDQDLSILVDESVKWKEIKDAIGMMVKELSFVEEYRGKQIPEGKKSIMLSYRIGNDDSTMTSKQIEKKMGAIVNVLKKKVGAELR